MTKEHIEKLAEGEYRIIISGALGKLTITQNKFNKNYSIQFDGGQVRMYLKTENIELVKYLTTDYYFSISQVFKYQELTITEY
jgi:hypothetical protein